MSGTEKYSEALVLRVNELVHDFVDQEYEEEVESQMHVIEKDRWLRAWRRHTPGAPRTIIDIGTGTGFVPVVLLPELDSGDRFICSDVSASILELARKKIVALDPSASTDYVHLSGRPPFRLPFGDSEADVITFNSVLHHLKETESFLREIDRVLKPGGLLFAGHEPNRQFREKRSLVALFWATRFLFLPREAVMVALREVGLYDHLVRLKRRLRKSSEETVADYVNRHVVREGLVDRPLRPSEIPAITDIRDREGFYPEKLLPGYRILSLETYNHLLTVDVNLSENRLVQRISRWAQRRYPEAGATFFAVYRKP